MNAAADSEPDVAEWVVHSFEEIAQSIATSSRARGARPVTVAVDGRSGSGKSTLADRLSQTVSGSIVVRSDDVAWWESFFDWDHLMVEGILVPVWRGEGVRYRPPAWDRRDRHGAIEVPHGASMLLVDGVGVGRRSLGRWFDASIWVQSDLDESRRRGIERDGGTEAAAAFWDEWSREESAFLAIDRPWTRARFVVCGTPQMTGIAHDAHNELLVRFERTN